eukprot:13900059-Ditylum_brightwellii.AAC.1
MAPQIQHPVVNSSMTVLPPDAHADQSSHQFQVNDIQCLQISNLEIKVNEELSLIDDGSNNGLAGAGMCFYDMTEQLEHVHIIGAGGLVLAKCEEISVLHIAFLQNRCTSKQGKPCLYFRVKNK